MSLSVLAALSFAPSARAEWSCQRLLSWFGIDTKPAPPLEPMTRVAWLTDVHLEMASRFRANRLVKQIEKSDADVVVISGDIATARTIEATLRWLDTSLNRPIFFVLGNHDFYGGEIRQTRARVLDLTRTSKNLRWLPARGIVRLNARTALVGVDGWGDARYGVPDKTEVKITDFRRIQNFHGHPRATVHAMQRALGDQSARRLERLLMDAFEFYDEVVVVTHVPPFEEACYHLGRPEPQDWLPYFACRAVGDTLFEIMRRHPNKFATVLTGHTHSPADAFILPNLHVIAGEAVYRKPRIQRVFSYPIDPPPSVKE